MQPNRAGLNKSAAQLRGVSMKYHIDLSGHYSEGKAWAGLRKWLYGIPENDPKAIGILLKTKTTQPCRRTNLIVYQEPGTISKISG